MPWEIDEHGDFVDVTDYPSRNYVGSSRCGGVTNERITAACARLLGQQSAPDAARGASDGGTGSD